MKKHYLYIILTYIVMQLSSIFALPLVKHYLNEGYTEKHAQTMATAVWTVGSFLVGLVIILLILWRSERNFRDAAYKMSWTKSILLGIAGMVIAIIMQNITGNIEHMLGSKNDSENTKSILELIRNFSSVIIVSSIVGPILEEIVFRKIIFGSIKKWTSFTPAAVISSLLFAVAHMDFPHLLTYVGMGLVFAFLYQKSNRIIVPMISHMLMNSLVVVVTLLHS